MTVHAAPLRALHISRDTDLAGQRHLGADDRAPRHPGDRPSSTFSPPSAAALIQALGMSFVTADFALRDGGNTCTSMPDVRGRAAVL